MPATDLSHFEEPISPDLSLVDPHHHFWGDGHPGAKAFGQFLPQDFTDDIARSGHRFAATVYVDCGWAFRDKGPEHLRCVGETDFVEATAKRFSPSEGPVGRIGAGIVGRADLMLGDDVASVLEAHLEASPARFRGIRELLAYDPDIYQALNIPQHKSRAPRFRAGMRQLERSGLSLDVLCAHTMLTDIVDLARDFPGVPIILNHLAGPIGVGRFRGMRVQVFADWRAAITELAACPNVSIKLSGVGADLMGFGWNNGQTRPNSEILATAIQPYIMAAIDIFSPARCMFASNFPVDGRSFSYGTLWNAFKHLAARYSADERDNLLRGTATRIYRLAV
ncbi:amidohydrolase [Niveispirillum sp.]|uniref:amidohydrolase family protein n=1 Tax=Niveispirillum sp. TaxID=1917217 RepID=UPI001B681787|nr:amidohydrolase family protein [Niveispirillum sp.]MBP7335987.1 amidohydrolase family protein [Niveispirillum sp.]